LLKVVSSPTSQAQLLEKKAQETNPKLYDFELILFVH
jgi:hypothetical protein